MAARRYTLTEFIAQSRERFGDKFCFKDSEYIGSKKPIKIRCKTHGVFETQPAIHLRLVSGCPNCGLRMTQSEFIQHATKRHGKRYKYDKVQFINTATPVKIGCHKHGYFMQEPYTHYGKGAGCPKCAIEKNGMSTEEFLYRCKKVHGVRYDYSKVRYKTGLKPVTIICKKHGPFKQEARVHMEGSGCKKCFLESNRSDKAEFITKSIELHGNRYDYSKVIYRDNKTKVVVICKQHGEFKIQPNAHLAVRGGCPRCSESKGESRIRLFLTKLGVEFVQEYRIEPYRYRYDFYVPKVNLLIEYHGEQHYRPVSIFGGEAGYKKTVKRDKVKREVARRSDYKMLTVSYRGFKSNNLERIIKARLNCEGYVFNKSL